MSAESALPQTFHAWLVDLLRPNLTAPDGCVFWFDPDGEWDQLLSRVAADEGWGYWDGARLNELELRQKLLATAPGLRIVRLPVARDAATWIAVLVPRAHASEQRRLAEALRDFGAEISWQKERELGSTLKVYGEKWLNEPAIKWQELGPDTIFSETEILDLIAAPGRHLAELEGERFTIFARRVVNGFGLPDPTGKEEDIWRREVMATLLVTEAAVLFPDRPSPDPHLVIPSGAVRDRALGSILARWRDSASCAETFERTVPQAELLTSLRALAADLPEDAPVTSSRTIEISLYNREAQRLMEIEDVRELARTLAGRRMWYAQHADGFYGRNAVGSEAVSWRFLDALAAAAAAILEGDGAGEWPTADAAFAWYTAAGWRIDAAGESLFEERDDFPHDLGTVRARLQNLYLQNLSRIGTRFSELLAANPGSLAGRPTAGERARDLLETGTGPVVFVFFDALRYDLGERLATLLNEGEASPRATVLAARAPLPSITPVGKPFALPVSSASVHVDYTGDGTVTSRVDGYDGDVSIAEAWRGWFRQVHGVKQICTVEGVLNGNVKRPSRSSQMLVVEGWELDRTGSIGELKLTGADRLLRRYAQAVRRLREKGWSRFVIVTDHGFFHWRPDQGEIVDSGVNGALLSSRRAIVGRDLTGGNALSLPASGSDLTVLVPYSTNAFRAYGGLGFFHGGATLQELVIPVLSVEWPRKAREVKVVLKHVGQITSLTPRVQVEAVASGQQTLAGPDPDLSARRVMVKVRDEAGRVVFRLKDPVTVESGGGQVTAVLALVPGCALLSGASLTVVVEDAETEERLDEEKVELKQDIDDW